VAKLKLEHNIQWSRKLWNGYWRSMWQNILEPLCWNECDFYWRYSLLPSTPCQINNIWNKQSCNWSQKL